MGHEAASIQRPAASQNRLEQSRSGTSNAILRGTGDGGRATDVLETGDWRLETSPGRVLGLVGPAGSGLTSVGIALLARATVNEPVAVLDVRGWFCPSLAWDAGIEPERLVVIRCADPGVWPKLAAALVEGFPAVYAEVPRRVPDQVLRRLGALARSRRSRAVLRAMEGDLPTGLLHTRVEGVAVRWEGPEGGHGRLQHRAVTIRVSGKGVQGIERLIEVEDDGAHTLRLVPRLAVAPAGRATG